MNPQVIFSQPQSKKARINKQKKQRRYRCPICKKTWVNRCQAVANIKKCQLKNNQQGMERQLLPQQQIAGSDGLGQMDDQRIQLSEYQKNEKILMMEKKLMLMSSEMQIMKEKMKMDEVLQYRNIELITNNIVQSDLVVSLLKAAIQPQVQQLLSKGFKANEIILKGKNIVNEKISKIRITQSFSNHQKNMQNLEKLIKQNYKKRNQRYTAQIILAFNFLKKFSERQMLAQTKLIEQISQMTFFKRSVVYKLYEKLRIEYHDIFKFDMLPKRLIKTCGGNKIKRKKINSNLLFSQIKRLLATNSFTLACDIWMGVCLGLRASQYRAIVIQRGTGQIAKLIRIVERKNNNLVSRLVPKSLANIIKKHDVSYPITQERFLQARNFCLKQFGTFYGLRSMAISLILGKLAYFSEYGRFHASTATTQAYYLNTEIQEVVNGLFALHGYDQNVQSNLEVVFDDGEPRFLQITDQSSFSINTQQSWNTYLQQSQKDSIILEDIQENQLTLVNKMRKIQLQNNIEAGPDQFSSINEALNLEKQSQQKISELCLNQNLCLSIVSINPQKREIQSVDFVGQRGGCQARLVQTISEQKIQGATQIIFKIDEGKMTKEQLQSKVNSFKISKLPILRSFLKCHECSLRYIINQCGNHFKLSCPTHGDNHFCSQKMSYQPKQRFLINTSILSHQFQLSKIKLSCKNNIRDVVRESNKKYTRRILYSSSVPEFKVNIPLGNKELLQNIKFVQENEQMLPLLIKQTKCGLGVFATCNIPKNTLICTYTGLIEEGTFVDKVDDSFVDVGMLKIGENAYNLLLTCTEHCNVGRFFNSSKTFQSKSKNLILEKTLDEKNRIVNIMYSSRQIEKDQQIKWYYGQQYWACSKIQPESDEEIQEQIDEQIIEQEHVSGEFQGIMGQQEQKIIRNPKDKNMRAMLVTYNNRVLEFDADTFIQVASIIKLLNVKVCLKEIDSQKISWETKFKMPFYFADQSTRVYLRTNSNYSVKNLIIASLVSSGCDAAHCLAWNIGQIYDNSNPIASFVKRMNEEALQINMLRTKIVQPTGYGASISTASDLLHLVDWMRRQKRIHTFLKLQKIKIERETLNTNQLLRRGILGKTANNQVDGHSFIGFHEQKNLNIVVLGTVEKSVTFAKVQQYIKRIMEKNF